MIVISRCVTCRHFRSVNRIPVCDAFPDRIPAAILSGKHDHTHPYPGDGGILYERDPALCNDYLSDRPEPMADTDTLAAW
jgi:hypothetical protein